MSDEPISSTRNPRVVAAAALQRTKARRQTGLSLLEGPHLLAAAVGAGAAIDSVFALADDTESEALAMLAGADFATVTRDVLHRLAPTDHPRGPVAVFRPPRNDQVTGSCVVLWGTGDPGNAGTMVRTAAAFGLGVVSGPATVDMWSPKVLRGAAGAHFSTSIQVVDGEPALRADGRTVVATVVEGGMPLSEVVIDGSFAILVGDEAHGLSKEMAIRADLAVTIPMPGGTESLNAAVAAAIVVYHLTLVS